MVDLVDLEIKLRKSSLSGHPKDPIPTVVRVRVEASDDVSNHEDETSSTTEAPQGLLTFILVKHHLLSSDPNSQKIC